MSSLTVTLHQPQSPTMFPLSVLVKAQQATAPAEDSLEESSNWLIRLLRSCENLSSMPILRHGLSISDEPQRSRKRYLNADLASFQRFHGSDGGRFYSTLLKRDLETYGMNLQGHTRSRRPTAEDTAATLNEYKTTAGTGHSFCCSPSKAGSGSSRSVLEVFRPDDRKLLVLCIQNRWKRSGEEGHPTSLIRIRDFDGRKDCCWLCLRRKELETERKTAMLQSAGTNDEARPRLVLDAQRIARTEDCRNECWPEEKVEDVKSAGLDLRSAKKRRVRDKHGRKLCATGNSSVFRDPSNWICESCSLNEERRPSRPKSWSGFRLKPTPFKPTPSKLHHVEGTHHVEIQYAHGKDDAKGLPPWTWKQSYMPSSFAPNEVLSPLDGSRRFVKLSEQPVVPFDISKQRLKGMPCLCESCMEGRWARFKPEVERTPRKTGIYLFSGQDAADRKRWRESRAARRQARQAFGFAKHSAGPSRLSEPSIYRNEA